MKKTNRTERLFERITPDEKKKLLKLLEYLREQETINQIEVNL